jgi:hypothetical protein
MNVLILNGAPDPRRGYNPLYRGTYRSHPSHCDQLPDEDEINQLFFWFLEEGGELGVVRNVTKALRFAELWNAQLKDRKGRFEVVEVTDENRHCESNGTFIGYDLSAGYNNSLLSWGLKPFAGGSRVAESIEELFGVVSRHYAPQLNGQGLFQTLEVASLCLRAMVALQDLSPNLFEGGNLREFRPVGLFRISAED